MPFSSASFRAKGDAKTRSPFVELLGFVACGSALLVGSSFFGDSFSFFSGFADGTGCSSEGFGFVVAVPLPSSL